MKKNLYVKAMSLAVVAATSFAVLACDNDNLSGPDFNSGNGGNSSAIEPPSPQSSSLDVGESSSSVNKLSSSSVVAGSSSVDLSSSSERVSSSSAIETCPNGRWTTICNGVESYEPVCCEEKHVETCRHITDYDGMTAQGNCVNQNGRTAVDCVTGENYECKSNNWQQVACMNVKPSECPPGMGGCGYRLCQPDGIREIADCENGVVYVCNGEMWEVKKTEENQRCARGELEYCEACFSEGEFQGRYKCEGGKWRKYGMGDEICVHITDVKCDETKQGCRSCGGNQNEIAIDCKTGNEFVCSRGFWSLNVVDCEARAEGCGRKDVPPPCEANDGGYCGPENDAWLNEPCEEGESSRDLRIRLSDGSYRSENYICVNNKWIERFWYYECGENEDCDRPSLRCQESSVIGTACDNEGEPSDIDGCVFLCSAGRFLYAPAPVVW